VDNLPVAGKKDAYWQPVFTGKDAGTTGPKKRFAL